LAKIGPVDFELIGLTGIFKNSQQAFQQPVGLNYNDTTNIIVVVIVKDD